MNTRRLTLSVIGTSHTTLRIVPNFLIRIPILRPDIEDLKLELKALGATEVFTYEELADKSFKQTWASIKGVSLSTALSSNKVPSSSSAGQSCPTCFELCGRQTYNENGHPS